MQERLNIKLFYWDGCASQNSFDLEILSKVQQAPTPGRRPRVHYENKKRRLGMCFLLDFLFV
jgi:hypothetical protein